MCKWKIVENNKDKDVKTICATQEFENNSNIEYNSFESESDNKKYENRYKSNVGR